MIRHQSNSIQVQLNIQLCWSFPSWKSLRDRETQDSYKSFNAKLFVIFIYSELLHFFRQITIRWVTVWFLSVIPPKQKIHRIHLANEHLHRVTIFFFLTLVRSIKSSKIPFFSHWILSLHLPHCHFLTSLSLSYLIFLCSYSPVNKLWCPFTFCGSPSVWMGRV